MSKVLKIIPELVVINVEKSVNFYTIYFGFKKIEGDSHWAKIKTDNSELILMLKSDFENELPTLKRPENSGLSILYFEVENIEELYRNLSSKVKFHRFLESTDYGTKEFTIEDPDSYLIQVTQRL